MSGPKGSELRLLNRERERLANERAFHTASNRYLRNMDDWRAVLSKCQELQLQVTCHPKSHDQLTGQLNQMLRDGDAVEAVRIWNAESTKLERAVLEAKQRVAERVVELENRRIRNLAFIRGAEIYRQKFETVIPQLKSLVPADWPDEARVEALLEWDSLKADCSPLLGGHATQEPIDPCVLEANESALRSKQESLAVRAQKFENHIQATHSKLVAAKVLSGAATTLKISQIFAELDLSHVDPSGPPKILTPAPIEEKLSKLMQDILAMEEAFDWKGILAEAEKIRAENDNSHRRNLYNNLVIRCSGRLKQIKALARWRESLLNMIDRAAAVPEDKALAEFRSRLEAILRKETPEDLQTLESELGEVLIKAISRQEQEKKRRALIEALTELGYEVSEGMQVADFAGGKLEFRKPEDEEYAIAVVMDNQAEILETEMVRYADSREMTSQQKQRDIEKEESWCSDHALVRLALESKGVASQFLYQKRPGEHPVSVKLTQPHSCKVTGKVQASRTVT